MDSLELLLFVVLIFLSAYMSASEIALFSLSRFQLRSLRDNFRSTHRKVKRLLSDPGGLLITILVVNEIINISLTTLIAEMISKSPLGTPNTLSIIPSWAYQTVLGILITAPIVLFLCEITPKVIGARVNQLIATMNAGPITVVYNLFKPIRFILKSIIQLISPSKRAMTPNGGVKKNSTDDAILKESEFLMMLEEGRKEGAIQESELELIRNVFALDNTTVDEVATPLSKVLSLNINTTIKGALTAVRSQKYSRIPVTGSNRKEVVGILYSKDLLRSKLQPDTTPTTVANVMRKPFFVTPNMNLNTLFRKFKQQKIHMAIVKGPNSDVIGVITMNDILDTLFEDLFIEDNEENLRKEES